MDDRYKFRGKRVPHGSDERFGDWVIGSYCGEMDGVHFIRRGTEFLAVDPETVGQCTGMKDKNEMPIFEGDILRITMPLPNTKIIVRDCPVFWHGVGWHVIWSDDRTPTRLDAFAPSVTFEVVGTIHDKDKEEPK